MKTGRYTHSLKCIYLLITLLHFLQVYKVQVPIYGFSRLETSLHPLITTGTIPPLPITTHIFCPHNMHTCRSAYIGLYHFLWLYLHVFTLCSLIHGFMYPYTSFLIIYFSNFRTVQDKYLLVSNFPLWPLPCWTSHSHTYMINHSSKYIYLFMTLLHFLQVY